MPRRFVFINKCIDRTHTLLAAKNLSKKFAALYYLLEDLLSPAKHYDEFRIDWALVMRIDT